MDLIAIAIILSVGLVATWLLRRRAKEIRALKSELDEVLNKNRELDYIRRRYEERAAIDSASIGSDTLERLREQGQLRDGEVQ